METTERQPAGWGRVVGGVVMLLPVLYVASIGPAVWVLARTGTNPTAMRVAEVIYLPLKPIEDLSPQFDRMIKDYVTWFIVRAVPPSLPTSPAPATPPPAP